MTFPLAVIRYLAELDAALAARNAPDRDQIVTQIGEHISQALDGSTHPSDSEIAAVLTELGDPLRIADEAAGHSGADEPTGRSSRPAPPPAPAPATPATPLLRRSWIPAAIAGLWVVGVVWPLLLLPWRRVNGGDMLGESVLIFARDIPLIASIVLVLCSPLYRPTGRTLWAVLSPLFLVSVLMLTRVSLFFRGVPVLFTAICAAVAIAGIVVVAAVTRQARRRASAPSPRAEAPRFSALPRNGIAS